MVFTGFQCVSQGLIRFPWSFVGCSTVTELRLARHVFLNGLLPYHLGHFQVGSYRYRSLIEGLYTL